jgi:ATP-dependent exoDNAse (exonuclease V) beta subunit
LEETALNGRDDSRDDKEKRSEHALTLMTLHSAKGLEFPRVYLVGMEEGLLPHQRTLLEGNHAIAEERRLAYVGVTRARDLLTLSLAKQRMKWGKARPTIVSRFLLEMRGETEKAMQAAQAAEEQLRFVAEGGRARPEPSAPQSQSATRQGTANRTRKPANGASATTKTPASQQPRAAAAAKKTTTAGAAARRAAAKAKSVSTPLKYS